MVLDVEKEICVARERGRDGALHFEKERRTVEVRVLCVFCICVCACLCVCIDWPKNRKSSLRWVRGGRRRSAVCRLA